VIVPSSEVFFVVEESPEGGFTARAVGHAVVTEAGDLATLRLAVQDAVRCHFEPAQMPQFIVLHFVHDEVLAM
jgi:hypothetical protein